MNKKPIKLPNCEEISCGGVSLIFVFLLVLGSPTITCINGIGEVQNWEYSIRKGGGVFEGGTMTKRIRPKTWEASSLLALQD